MADLDLTGELGKKIGPLPIGAWVLIGGGAVGLYMLHTKKATGTAAPADGAVAAGDLGAGGSTYAYPVSGSAAADGSLTGAVAPTSTTPTSNAAWSVLAQNYLIAEGFDPVTVANALNAYLSGSTLTAQQQSLVSEAIRSAGPTPETVATPITTPAGVTPLTGNDTPTTTVTPTKSYDVQFHRVGIVGQSIDARTYIQSLSNRTDRTTASFANDVESALRATVADPRNSQYIAFFQSHNGQLPGGAAMYVTVPMMGS